MEVVGSEETKWFVWVGIVTYWVVVTGFDEGLELCCVEILFGRTVSVDNNVLLNSWVVVIVGFAVVGFVVCAFVVDFVVIAFVCMFFVVTALVTFAGVVGGSVAVLVAVAGWVSADDTSFNYHVRNNITPYEFLFIHCRYRKNTK